MTIQIFVWSFLILWDLGVKGYILNIIFKAVLKIKPQVYFLL